jgi:hypothetical protein
MILNSHLPESFLYLSFSRIAVNAEDFIIISLFCQNILRALGSRLWALGK